MLPDDDRQTSVKGPVSPTGEDRHTSVKGPVSPTGDDRQTSVKGPVSPTGEDRHTSVKGPVSPTGDDRQTSVKGPVSPTGVCTSVKGLVSPTGVRTSVKGPVSPTGVRTSVKGPVSPTGDDRQTSVKGPVSPTGVCTSVKGPVSPTGDDRHTSVKGPVSPTGDDRHTSVKGPVSPTGDDRQTSVKGPVSLTGDDRHTSVKGPVSPTGVHLCERAGQSNRCARSRESACGTCTMPGGSEREMRGPVGERERGSPPGYQSVTTGQPAPPCDSDYMTHDPPPTSYHDSSTLLVRRGHPDREPGCPSASGCPPPPSTLHHPDTQPGCPPTSPPPSSLHRPIPDQPMPPSPQVSPPATSHATENADDIVELPDDTDQTGRQEKGQDLTDQQQTDDDLRMTRNLGDRPGGQAGEAEDGGGEARGDVPNTHLLMACLVCLCFNLPLGIVAMYLSLRAAQAYRAGHDKLGLRRSRCSVLVSLLAIAVTTVIVSSVVFYMATQGHKRISRQRAYGAKSGLSL